MQTATIILIGTGGELDRETVDVPADNQGNITLTALLAASDNATDWIIGDGDTIKIEIPEA